MNIEHTLYLTERRIAVLEAKIDQLSEAVHAIQDYLSIKVRSTAYDRVLGALMSGHHTAPSIATHTGYSVAYMYQLLSKMVRANMITRSSQGHYELIQNHEHDLKC